METYANENYAKPVDAGDATDAILYIENEAGRGRINIIATAINNNTILLIAYWFHLCYWDLLLHQILKR